MKKLKIIIVTIIQIGVLQLLPAQTFTNNGATIYLNTGSSLTIKGDFLNLDDGNIGNASDLYISGNWINNATSGNLLAGTVGTVHFNGVLPQYIDGSAKTFFGNLHIQNDVRLNTETSIIMSLLLDGSSLNLLNKNLIMMLNSPINGACASGYIITEGAGRLIQEVGNNDVLFPVGTSSSYIPLTINNSGSTDSYKLRVFDDVLDGGLSGTTIPEINNCVNMTWEIEENNPGGSNLSVSVE